MPMMRYKFRVARITGGAAIAIYFGKNEAKCLTATVKI